MFGSSRLVASKAVKSTARARPHNSILPQSGSGSWPTSHIGSGVRQLKTLRVG